MSKLAKALSGAAGNAGGTEGYVEDVFSTYLYTGNATARSFINGIDLSGEGGLVWTKIRGPNGNSHYLYDTERTRTQVLSTNTMTAQQTDPASGSYGLTSFNSDGYSIGAAGYNADLNPANQNMASWSFRKAPKFFDIQTWSGNDSTNRQLSHNLGSVPGMMIVKKTTGTYNWQIYHVSNGNTKFMEFGTGAPGTSVAVWNNTTPTDSVFTVGNEYGVNQSGSDYVAYLFASDAGGYGDDGDENIVKCGSFSTTGSSTVTLGFEPQWLMVKQTNGVAGWYMWDTMRGWTVGAAGSNNDPSLYANTNGAEVGYGVSIGNPTATGFVTENFASGDYIYIAIRRPMKTPTAGTEVFTMDTRGSTGDGVAPAYRSTWPVDMIFYKNYTSPSYSILTTSRLIAPNYLYTANTDVQSGVNSLHQFDYENGYYNDAGTGSTQVSWMFKRATGFMDVVCYAGNSTAGTTQAHNLGVVPELIIWKTKTGTADAWITYSAPTGVGYYILGPSGNAGSAAGSLVNSTLPTASTITLSGTGWNVNNTNSTYIAYLFATLAGVSKVGSYTGTGTGTTVDVDCGFTGGARFILIKRTDSAGDWFVYDYFRGINAGDSPYLFLNTVAAQVNTDYIDPLNAGFTVTTDAAVTGTLNVSGATYIFLAIA